MDCFAALAMTRLAFAQQYHRNPVEFNDVAGKGFLYESAGAISPAGIQPAPR
jgi:hypothetical protein